MSQTNYQNNFEPKPHYAVTTGTSTAYEVSIPGLTLQTGISISIKTHVACGANATININGAGAKTIKKDNGANTTAGDLELDGVYTFVYDGVFFMYTFSTNTSSMSSDYITLNTYNITSQTFSIGGKSMVRIWNKIFILKPGSHVKAFDTNTLSETASVNPGGGGPRQLYGSGNGGPLFISGINGGDFYSREYDSNLAGLRSTFFGSGNGYGFANYGSGGVFKKGDYLYKKAYGAAGFDQGVYDENAVEIITDGTQVYVGGNPPKKRTLSDMNTAVSGTVACGNILLVYGTFMYAEGASANVINVYNTSDMTLSTTITVGNGPHTIVVIGSELYITNYAGGNISIVNATTNTLVGTNTSLANVTSCLSYNGFRELSDTQLRYTPQAGAPTPTAGKAVLYFKSNGKLYTKNSSGTESLIGTQS